MTENITDVFFDLDHTLWDFDKNSALTFNKIFTLNNIDINVDEFLKAYEPINLNYWKLYREEKIDKESLRYGRLHDAFSALSKNVEKDLILKLSNDYITHLSSYNYLLDNAINVLNYLKNQYKLHIITNGFDEVQHKKLTKSNILHYFKTVTNSEMVGVKKPNPKIFNFALNKAQVNPENSIMIGDSYEADIIGAQNIGMHVIYLKVDNTPYVNGVKTIDNLLQLKEYL